MPMMPSPLAEYAKNVITLNYHESEVDVLLRSDEDEAEENFVIDDDCDSEDRQKAFARHTVCHSLGRHMNLFSLEFNNDRASHRPMNDTVSARRKSQLQE